MKVISVGDIRRILVLNRNQIGDCVLTTPMLRALKRRFPRARVFVSIPKSNQDLLVTNPHVDEIVLRPRRSSWAAKCRFAFQMRRAHYDLIISLQEKSLFYAWATHSTGLLNPRRPVNVALEHLRTRRWYQHISPVRADQHEVLKYLEIAHMLGCPREHSPVLELEPPADARAQVQRFLGDRCLNPDARFIGINPGGTKREKRWPVERFAQVADRLHTELGLTVMVLGGPTDREMAARIAQRMQHRPVVVAGRASLGETAAYLERCAILVTGDTGPMHMAVAMAVPVVALFGPTSPIKFGPFTTLGVTVKHDEPCPRCPKPCLHTITVDECVEAALGLYKAPPVSRVRSDHH